MSSKNYRINFNKIPTEHCSDVTKKHIIFNILYVKHLRKTIMELGVKSGLLAWSVYQKLVGISTFSEICIFKDGVKMPQIGSKIAKKGGKKGK